MIEFNPLINENCDDSHNYTWIYCTDCLKEFEWRTERLTNFVCTNCGNCHFYTQ